MRFQLPGFPSRQTVIWGDLLPNAVVLPLSLGPSAGSVCTIEALHSCSSLQLVALACRTCLLPDFLLESVADGEAVLWVNEQRTFPTDPSAAIGADTARLLGHGVAALLGHSSPFRDTGPSQASSSSSSSSGVRSFLRPLAEIGDGAGSHFVVFSEPNEVCIMPIPGGAALADLVHRAFIQFPRLGPRCGHRLLRRPIPGYPNLQICIWDQLGVDQRVLQLVVGPEEIWTIRCPAVSSPRDLAASSGHDLLRDAASKIQDRNAHLEADGIPLQPHHVYLFRNFEVLRPRRGPPPSRLPGITRFCRGSLPESLECLSTVDVSDEPGDNSTVIHRVGSAPHTVIVDPLYFGPLGCPATSTRF